jgi:hypothetical protein
LQNLCNIRKFAPGRISSPSQIQKKPELLVAVLCPSSSPLASKSAERKHCEDEEKMSQSCEEGKRPQSCEEEKGILWCK